ncbi:hypothetical protein, partial [Bradyrhizobium sp.]
RQSASLAGAKSAANRSCSVSVVMRLVSPGRLLSRLLWRKMPRRDRQAKRLFGRRCQLFG